MLPILLVLILFSHIVTGINVKLVPDENNYLQPNIITCIHEIYDFHQNFYKLTIVIHANDNGTNIPNDIFTEKSTVVKTNNINELNEVIEIYEGTVLIVIYFKSCNDLPVLEKIIFHIKFRYIIILDTCFSEKCLKGVKIKLSKLNTYDVVFITTDIHTSKYNIITSIPEIDADTCDITKIVKIKIINVCQNGTLDKKNINDVFPAKEPRNLKMCNFKVGMGILYPYTMVNNKELLKDLDTTGNIHGADVEIMKIIANKINSTLRLFYLLRDYRYPHIFQQLVPYFLNGTLDAAAGGLYRVYNDKVAYSGLYLKESIFWVFTVERDRRSWQSLVVKMTGFYIFFITYMCYVFLWNVFNQFDYQTMSIIDTLVYGWGAMVGAAGLREAKSVKHKILNIMYLIMCLHLSAYLSTQIYYYLTIEAPPHYFKTNDELTLSDKIPYLMKKLKFFVDDKEHTAYVNKSLDCQSFTHCVELMLKHKTSTILMEGLLPRIQATSSVNDEASVMRVPEDILITYHEMIMRKNSFLVKIFKKSIQRLFEAGICQRAYEEAIGITVFDKAKIANKNILSNSYSCKLGCEITLSQSAVAFYLWIFGCCISCCIFVFELLMKPQTTIKNID